MAEKLTFKNVWFRSAQTHIRSSNELVNKMFFWFGCAQLPILASIYFTQITERTIPPILNSLLSTTAFLLYLFFSLKIFEAYQRHAIKGVPLPALSSPLSRTVYDKNFSRTFFFFYTAFIVLYLLLFVSLGLFLGDFKEIGPYITSYGFNIANPLAVIGILDFLLLSPFLLALPITACEDNITVRQALKASWTAIKEDLIVYLLIMILLFVVTFYIGIFAPYFLSYKFLSKWLDPAWMPLVFSILFVFFFSSAFSTFNVIIARIYALKRSHILSLLNEKKAS